MAKRFYNGSWIAAQYVMLLVIMSVSFRLSAYKFFGKLAFFFFSVKLLFREFWSTSEVYQLIRRRHGPKSDTGSASSTGGDFQLRESPNSSADDKDRILNSACSHAPIRVASTVLQKMDLTQIGEI